MLFRSRTILRGTRNVTFLPVLGFGLWLYVNLGGLMTDRCGQAPARANLSARQAKEKGLLTSGTFGPRSTTLSTSAGLQLFLANRLQAKTVSTGSILYNLTWKDRVTPRGQPICALRASGLRTSGNASTGWQIGRAHV